VRLFAAHQGVTECVMYGSLSFHADTAVGWQYIHTS